MTDATRLDTSPRYRPETPWAPGAAIAVTLAASLAPLLIGVVVLIVVGTGLVTTDGRLVPYASPSLASPVTLGEMIAGQLLSLTIIWAAAGWRGARREVLQLAPPQETGWLAAIGYGLALIVIIGPIELLFYRMAGVELFADGVWLLEGLRSPLWWIVAVAAVILAPLWEELVFRGFLLSALAKSRLGFWPAAAISSGIWTALHAGYSWPGLASVFLAGIGLSWIMLRTGSMRAVVVAHGVINAFSLTVVSLFAP